MLSFHKEFDLRKILFVQKWPRWVKHSGLNEEKGYFSAEFEFNRGVNLKFSTLNLIFPLPAFLIIYSGSNLQIKEKWHYGWVTFSELGGGANIPNLEIIAYFSRNFRNIFTRSRIKRNFAKIGKIFTFFSSEWNSKLPRRFSFFAESSTNFVRGIQYHDQAWLHFNILHQDTQAKYI